MKNKKSSEKENDKNKLVLNNENNERLEMIFDPAAKFLIIKGHYNQEFVFRTSIADYNYIEIIENYLKDIFTRNPDGLTVFFKPLNCDGFFLRLIVLIIENHLSILKNLKFHLPQKDSAIDLFLKTRNIKENDITYEQNP